MADKIFANGLIVKRNEKALDFVICNLSFKVDEFTDFLNQNIKNGWVNVEVKKARESGKFYGELNNWEKPQGEVKTDQVDTSINSDDQLGANKQNTTTNDVVEDISTPENEINPEDIPF